jgi:hypothetical protein
LSESSASSSNQGFWTAPEGTFTITDSVALRVYSNAKPRNMKIANLQKGMILVLNGVEVVGEGTGFGVPILKYRDETVFSGSSILYVLRNGSQMSIRKEFIMNLVARDRFRNLNLENRKIRSLIDQMCILYQKHKHLAQSILLGKRLLFKFGVNSSFIQSPPKGRVVVTYTINQNRLTVKSGFNLLNRNNLEKVFVMNEQGAQFFRIYFDSDGLRLADEEVGVWDHVTAQSAKISDYMDRIGFTLRTVDESNLRRGREFMAASLDWIGLDYELSPEKDLFEYEIEILGDSIK